MNKLTSGNPLLDDDPPTAHRRLGAGTDITVDPDEVAGPGLDREDLPATSDPDQMTDDVGLGGVGGRSSGGAG